MTTAPSSLDERKVDKLLRGVQPRPFPTYDELNYSDFLHTHLIPNSPFMLSPLATASWPARTLWATTSLGPRSSPNLDALQRYAHHVVPVAKTTLRDFSEFERSERALGTVLDQWEVGDGADLYVKDWHLAAELDSAGGTARDVYAPPECLRDDWLNPPFHEESNPTTTASSVSASTADFRFVYAGPAGTFTPLHRDVYGSYSWSANVVGRKVWWLFPPGADSLSKVKDAHGQLVFDVRELDEEGSGIKIVQEEGEVIFVPSGWHHQVVNIDFCISINHNFFSSPTLSRIYDALVEAQTRVSESIADILPDIRARLGPTSVLASSGVPAWEAEWAEEVEALLERDAGWGWRGFWACIRDNIERPPAIPSLSPSIELRDTFVQEVVDRFKSSREFALLPAVKELVLQVESSLRARAS